MINFIFLTLILLAGVAKGFMDALQFHYYDTIFHKYWPNKAWYFNPAESWKNKYSLDREKESFRFSTTLLVFTTDGWHLFQFLYLRLLIAGVLGLSYNNFLGYLWYYCFIIPGLLGLGFYISYNLINYAKS